MLRELSLNILDLAQNSIAAGSKQVKISVELDTVKNNLKISISDDGKGMDFVTLQKVQDPFFTSRTTRRVGLGIPFFAQTAVECDGSFKVDSEPGKGTTVEASFRADHIDRMPLGDIVSTLVTLMASNPEMDFVYEHKKDDAGFVFDTRDLRDQLQEVSLAEPEVLKWTREYLESNLMNELRID